MLLFGEEEELDNSTKLLKIYGLIRNKSQLALTLTFELLLIFNYLRRPGRC